MRSPQALGSSRQAEWLLLQLASGCGPVGAPPAPLWQQQQGQQQQGQQQQGQQQQLQVCSSPEQRQQARSVLHQLGFALGVVLWQEDWLRCLRRPQQQQQQQQQQAEEPHQAGGQRLQQQQFGGAAAEPGAAVAATPSQVAAAALAIGTGVLEGGAGVAAPEDEEEEAHCRAVVDAIRRDEFGLGLELEGAGKRQYGGKGAGSFEWHMGVGVLGRMGLRARLVQA